MVSTLTLYRDSVVAIIDLGTKTDYVIADRKDCFLNFMENDVLETVTLKLHTNGKTLLDMSFGSTTNIVNWGVNTYTDIYDCYNAIKEWKIAIVLPNAIESALDGNKGDITVSDTGDTWTVNAGVINTTKLGDDITAYGKSILQQADEAELKALINLESTSDLPEGTNLYFTEARVNALLDTYEPPPSAPPDLGYTASPTNGIVTNSQGADATIPLATGTNAGLLSPADFTTIAGLGSIGGVEQFPAYTDFPGTGSATKLYIAKDTRLAYYWNTTTSAYVKEGSFNSDFTVYLDQSSGFKTFMKWKNTEVVPAADKHPSELLLLGAIEAIAPTITLTTSTTIAFNQTAVSNVLNFTKTVNLPGTSVATVSLEWRRNNTGSWTVLSTNTGLTTYTHGLTDSANNTQPFNYRYIVTDNLGGTATATVNITPAAYVAPTLTSFTTSQGTSRELGNTTSNISGTITRNSPNIALTSYQIEYQVNGGSWVALGSPTSISGASAAVSVTHTDGALVNSTSIAYRLKVIDAFQTTTLGSYTVSYVLRSVLGYNTATSLSLADITAISTNISLTNSKTRTISGVTATGGNYTYYVYASSAGDLSGVIMDGAAPVLGAFTKLTDVTGNNAYGASVSYRVYKSNSTNAFSSNSLAFS